MENLNNWSMVELESPSDDDFIYPNDAAPKGGWNKNAKQLTWVLLLKAHRAAGCLASIAAAFLSLTSIVRRRVASGRTDSTDNPRAAVNSRFYLCIKAFLWLSLLLLGFEVAAYFKGWHFGHPDLQLQHLYTLADAAAVRTAFEYEFVAIFYADFQPNPDFLMKTIPHFKISIFKKANMIFLFFLLRKLILPFYSFTLFCIILPMTMFIPEATLPAWVVCYIPATMSNLALRTILFF